MTEDDYVRVGDLLRIRTAFALVTDALSPDKDLRLRALGALNEMETRLVASIELEEE